MISSKRRNALVLSAVVGLLAYGLVPISRAQQTPVAGPRFVSDEQLTQHAGVGSQVVHPPANVASGGYAAVPKGNGTVRWVHYDFGVDRRYSGDPTDPSSWTDSAGAHHRSFWRPISTDCVPCQPFVFLFNDTMDQVFRLRATLEEIEARRAGEVAVIERDIASVRPTSKTPSSGGLNSPQLKHVIDLQAHIDVINQAAADETKVRKAEIAANEQRAKVLARKIADCERQCAAGTATSGLAPAGLGGWIPRTPITAPGLTDLPFPWKGPYTTNCYACRKLAVRLNELPGVAVRLMGTINFRADELQFARAVLQPWRRVQMITGPDLNRAVTPEIIASLQSGLDYYRARLKRLTAYFNQVLGLLHDCEQKYCATPRSTDKRVGLAPSPDPIDLGSACAYGHACAPLSTCLGDDCLALEDFCTEEHGFCASGSTVDPSVQLVVTGQFTMANALDVPAPGAAAAPPSRGPTASHRCCRDRCTPPTLRPWPSSPTVRPREKPWRYTSRTTPAR